MPGCLVDEIHNSWQDFGSDASCWLNFAIFFNAWSLCSHHSGLPIGAHSQSTWNIVDTLIQRCIKEQLASVRPMLTCPGSNLPVLVQLVTESYSWHVLVIQSCLRSMLPSGKKKKKTVLTDQSNVPLSHVIRCSIESLSSAIEEVKKWLDHQLSKSLDESMDVLFSCLRKTECGEEPGNVFRAVEDFASAGNPDLGERISQALHSWNSADVLRKYIKGQYSMLYEFRQICESKLRLLDSLKMLV
uniref:PAB-dependent poly(A)-specific ribonuclease subunit pan3 n=1 Tax=Anthurium amnicola TaxID=1678845 RepID=A0A1D1ZKS0_9ARAE